MEIKFGFKGHNKEKIWEALLKTLNMFWVFVLSGFEFLDLDRRRRKSPNQDYPLSKK